MQFSIVAVGFIFAGVDDVFLGEAVSVSGDHCYLALSFCQFSLVFFAIDVLLYEDWLCDLA